MRSTFKRRHWTWLDWFMFSIGVQRHLGGPGPDVFQWNNAIKHGLIDC